jgi:nucleoid DNA-binding protein
MATKKTTADETEEVIVQEDAAPDTEAASDIIRKKDLYDHVVVSTGLRKREAREAIDSVLEFMHQCLSEGKEVQCPPLGKLRVIVQKAGTPDEKMTYKLNLRKSSSPSENSEEDAKEALAEAQD